MTRWYSREDLHRESRHYAERIDVLRKLIVELAAALVRLDRNGYQAPLLERVLKEAVVTRDQVDEFNVQRARRIAARKGAQ